MLKSKLRGIPKYDAAVLYTTIENRAAESASRAVVVSAPKSTILLIVEATDALIRVIMRTPRKLNAALIIIAGRGRMQRVVMHVAIAFGASVHPLTKMTPSVRAAVIINAGDEKICCQKFANETSISKKRKLIVKDV